MSNKRLLTGDAVRVYIDDISNGNRANARTAIGFIRFIGFIPDLETHKFTQSIGVELLQTIDDGHNGMINNVQYFNVDNGHGIHVPVTNIIEILSITTIMLELKHTLRILKEKNNQIHSLESILSSRKKYSPHKKPTFINVDLPPSHRNTFILPEPITPISLDTPNTPNSLSCFPSMKSMKPEKINTEIIITPAVDMIEQVETPSISLTQSETFSSYASSVISESINSNYSITSVPSTPNPITPMASFTPTSSRTSILSPYVIYENEQSVNNKHSKHAKHAKHSKSKSFSSRNSLYRKKKKKSKKSSQTLTIQNSAY